MVIIIVIFEKSCHNYKIKMQKKKQSLIIIVVVSVLLAFLFSPSCREQGPFKGYATTNSGLYYKIISLGDGIVKPAYGDYLQLTITYKTLNDSVFLDTYLYNETGMVILPYNKSSFKGSFEEGISKMNEGDTYSFIVNSDSLFEKFFHLQMPLFLEKDNYVKMDVTLSKILTNDEYLTELKEFHVTAEHKEQNEKNKLLLFLDTCDAHYFSIDSELYYLPIKQGVGDAVKYGDEVYIHYKGYFLNGVQFESTYSRNKPLQFMYGQEGQVIKGIEKALIFMNEGAKTKFIIPSQLAYGKTGSSTGIIPPFTTVIYEIELLNLVKNYNKKDSIKNKKIN